MNQLFLIRGDPSSSDVTHPQMRGPTPWIPFSSKKEWSLSLCFSNATSNSRSRLHTHVWAETELQIIGVSLGHIYRGQRVTSLIYIYQMDTYVWMLLFYEDCQTKRFWVGQILLSSSTHAVGRSALCTMAAITTVDCDKFLEQVIFNFFYHFALLDILTFTNLMTI